MPLVSKKTEFVVKTAAQHPSQSRSAVDRVPPGGRSSVDREPGAQRGVGAEWCQGVQFPEILVDLGPGSEEVFPERYSPKWKEGRKRLPEEPKGVQMGVPRALKWYHIGPGPEPKVAGITL